MSTFKIEKNHQNKEASNIKNDKAESLEKNELDQIQGAYKRYQYQPHDENFPS